MNERRVTADGRIIERLPDGTIVEVGQQSQGVVLPAAPPSPTAQFEVPKAEADINKTQAETDRIRAATQLIAAQIAAASNPQTQGAAKLTSGDKTTALRAYNDAAALERIADDIEAKFKAGPGATSGLYSVLDYLPLEANKIVDDASFQARGYVKRALGFTGGEGNTIGEIQLNYGPYLAESSDKDGQALEKVKALRQLANDSRTQAVAVLGGVPDANGNITPMPNAMLGPNSAAPLTAAGMDATQQSIPIPPEMQQAHATWVAQNAGRITPDSYAAFRSQLDEQFGFSPNVDAYRAAAPGINQAAQNSNFGASIPAVTRDMTADEQARNNLATSPGGAFLTGFGDSIGLGVISASDPERMAALEGQSPLSTMAGQIGGAIAGTGGIGAAGRFAAGRLAPNLLGGAGRAQFGRNLAADAAYGAGYGGVTEGDPLTGAALGVAGSAIGQGVGGAIGKAVGGVNVDPAVRFLQERNIPVTTGQLLGGFAKRAEDRAASMPVIGDMIAARQSEGIEAFNREALGVAGEPIGFTPTATGRQGFDQLVGPDGAIGRAYDDATAGVRAPVDQQYAGDLAGMQRFSDALPPDAVPAFEQVGRNYAMPIADAGEMTGETFQNTQRALKMKRNSAPGGAQGFEQEWKDAISAFANANRALMNRQGGDAVVKGLDDADFAYRMGKTVQNAAERADGNDYMFTASQLQDAVKATQRKFPGGNPLQELADNGQRVLPSRIPNSGTADRAAQMALAASPTAALGGLGFLSGGQDGAQTGGITGAALTLAAILGGTRGGQRAINAALASRSPFFNQMGNTISRRKGLFGSTGNIMAQQ